VTIPDSVTSIGNSAFSGCVITNVTIGDSVASIGDFAFMTCYSLTSVTIPNSVTNVGFESFYNCYHLTNVTFGSSVTSIGGLAFAWCSGLKSVTIPASVTNIGDQAFIRCSGLTNIAVNAANPNYAGVSGVLFNKAVTTLIQYPQGLAGSYTIPNGVTNVSGNAFEFCSTLTNVIIPNSVISVGSYAFSYCTSLHQAHFQGNAPNVNGGTGNTDSTVFSGESGTAYILLGTTGWAATFGGWPTTGWYQPQPQILGAGSGLGPLTNGFGFTISWATNTVIVVEASTNLQNWTPVITNTLVNGTNAFGDSTWTNYPQRFYRVRSQ
jgi:hypothetical protein